MADRSIEDIEKAIVDLEAKQREFGINLSNLMELEDRTVSQTGSGIIAPHGLPYEEQDRSMQRRRNIG